MANTRRQYGTGSVSQRSDGYWIGRIEGGTTPQGTRRRITVSAKTKADCLAKLKAKQRDIALNGIPAAGSARITVKAWADQWLPIHATKVRPTTYATDAGTIGKWIVPTIGHRRLADLTPVDLRNLRAAITGAGRSSTTAGHAHRVLRKMLRDALVEGHTVPQRILEVEAPAKAANDRTAIPLDQAVAILGVAAHRDDAARWVAGMLQGMRQGEALGLTWDAVNLDTGMIDISWQLQLLPAKHVTPDGWEARHLTGLFWLTRPKTSAGKRTVPMLDWMHAAMRKAREQWQPNPYGLVWVNRRGLPIRDIDDRHAFAAIQQQAGVAHPSGRPWHGHEMRHTAISMMIAAGVDRSMVQRIVGQSKLVETYIHITPEQMRAAMAQSARDLGLTIATPQIEG